MPRACRDRRIRRIPHRARAGAAIVCASSLALGASIALAACAAPVGDRDARAASDAPSAFDARDDLAPREDARADARPASDAALDAAFDAALDARGDAPGDLDATDARSPCPSPCRFGTTCAPAGYCVGPTGVPVFGRVYVVAMEDRSLAELRASDASRYISELGALYASASAYRAVQYPGLPDYLALTAGTTFGVVCDCRPTGVVACNSLVCNRTAGACSCPVPAMHLGDQLDGAGIPWRAYAEGMGTPCNTTDAPARRYAVRRVPFLYFDDVRVDLPRCRARVRDYGDFAADLAAGAARFAFIAPDACHAMNSAACGGASGRDAGDDASDAGGDASDGSDDASDAGGDASDGSDDAPGDDAGGDDGADTSDGGASGDDAEADGGDGAGGDASGRDDGDDDTDARGGGGGGGGGGDVDPIAEGDAWLAVNVPPILATRGFDASGADVLFIVWSQDNGASTSTPLPFIVVSPLVRGGAVSATAYDHYSLLATIEEGLGLPRLGLATSARPIADIWR